MTTTEIFVPNNGRSSHLIVDFVITKIDLNNNEFMIVSYKNREYKLNWDDNNQCFTGRIENVSGYIM